MYSVAPSSGQRPLGHSSVKSRLQSGPWSLLCLLHNGAHSEMTVVLEPLALVVTVTTAGRVAVVVRMVG